MKKVLTVLLLSILCLALVGCETKNINKDGSKEKVTTVVGKYTKDKVFDLFITFEFVNDVFKSSYVKVEYVNEKEAKSFINNNKNNKNYVNLKREGKMIYYDQPDSTNALYKDMSMDRIKEVLIDGGYTIVEDKS